MITKKATISLSINILVVIILAIATMALVITFNKTFFEKTSIKFEEQLAREPEPLIPSASQPITVSRENIKTDKGETEVIKFTVFNPTAKDWIFRDVLHGGSCGFDGDLICFIDPSDTTGTCDTYANANNNDLDCKINDEDPFGHDDVCVIHTVDNAKGKADPDCAPQEGVQLIFACDDKLIVKTFKQNTKIIKAGEYESFSALVEIEKSAPEGSYLCNLNVFGGNHKFTKDVIFRLE